MTDVFNDLMILILNDIELFFGCLIFSLILHEIGHYIPSKIFGSKPRFAIVDIGFGKILGVVTEKVETNEQFIMSEIGGILLGLIPLYYITGKIFLIIGFLLIYIKGCLFDVLNIIHRIKLIKQEKIYNKIIE